MGSNLKQPPSANWLALQKVGELLSYPKRGQIFKVFQKINPDPLHRRKKRKLDHETTPEQHFKRGKPPAAVPASTQNLEPLATALPTGMKNGESIDSLRRMILGELEDQYTDHQKRPGRYVALDCEMVGVGIDGKESSLARVSVVNYHGAVLLDQTVKQRERVVDYRTQWSGIRPADMVNALPFAEVQRRVANLLEDKILVGHAVFNDLKALLLSHPFPLTRDTQQFAFKYKLSKDRRPALRKLTTQEFGIEIQGGEHSSVTDARATMAVYRLHRREWEQGKRLPLPPSGDSDRSDVPRTLRKRKHADGDNHPPDGGKIGISSGLSTVVKPSKMQNTSLMSNKKTEWWSELGSSKGSLRIP